MTKIKHRAIIIIHSLDEVPAFGSEDEEREWWSTHELSEDMYASLLDRTSELDRVAPVPSVENKPKKTARAR